MNAILTERPTAAPTIPAAATDTAGRITLRYGLVVILLWIGAMKFTAYEAEGIRPFVEGSPFFAWTYPVIGSGGCRTYWAWSKLPWDC